MLTNSGQLDREALDPNLEGEILLNVSATDRGTPALKTIVPVIINLEVSLQQVVAGLCCCVATDAARPYIYQCFLLLHPRTSMTTNQYLENPLTNFLLKRVKGVSI